MPHPFNATEAYVAHLDMIRDGNGMHECASDCPLPPVEWDDGLPALPERLGRPGPRWLQDSRCFLMGHDWLDSPWCRRCGRLEHYS